MLKKKEKPNRENKKKRSLGGSLVSIAVFVGMVGLAIHTILAIKDMYVQSPEHFNAGAEAELLASGLAIIGLAIAIWTGLNIANAIQQRDVQDLSDTVQNLKHTAEDLQSTTADVETAIRHLDPQSLFLQEFLKTNTDYTSTFLYYSLCSAEHIQAPWGKLMQLERLYTRANKMHKGLVHRQELLAQVCRQGLELIEELGMEHHPAIARYLLARTADFNWFRGYATRDPSQAAIYFCNTLDAYLTLFPLMEIDPHFTKDTLPHLSGSEQDFVIYITNTLSLCYLRLSQRYGTLKSRSYVDPRVEKYIRESPQKAVQYGQCAEAWIESPKYDGECKKEEFYYRNLGVAYEQLDRHEGTPFGHAEAIFSLYRKAFSRMVQDGELTLTKTRSVYQVLLSYYKRYLDAQLDLGAIWGQTPRQPSGTPNADVQARLQEFLRYTQYALRDGRRYNLTLVMHGFANCYALLAERLYGISVEGASLAAAREAKEDLELLGWKDPYQQQLVKAIEYLQETPVREPAQV